MGVNTRRPPLPAPTDLSATDNTSAIGQSDDLATDISRRTDRTSYSIPEDGSPVTITTGRPKDRSQTSLLIEYFETSKSGDKLSSRPSVRVKVTPSSHSRSKSSAGHEHIQITKSKKNQPTFTRRISLPSRSKEGLGSEVSSLSEGSSGPPPFEVEVFQDNSDLSQNNSPSRRVVLPSDVSSMPTDSLLDGPSALVSPRKSRSASVEKTETVSRDTLKAPERRPSRSISRERIIPKVMEKLQQDSAIRIKESGKQKHDGGAERSRGSRSRSVSYEVLPEDEVIRSRKRSSKPRDDHLASEISAVSSVRSGTSTSSINNPKLLNAVEDAIKKLILPEINAIKTEQKNLKNQSRFEQISRERSSRSSHSREDGRRVSKSSSLPSVSQGKSSIDVDERMLSPEGSGRRRSSRRSSRGSEKSYDTAVQDDSSTRRRSSKDKSSRGAKELLAAAAAGAAVAGITSAALKHHNSSSTLDKDREHRRRRKSRSRSRTTSLSESYSEHAHESIPPLPMQSTMDSEVTRASIQSADTERPSSRAHSRVETPTPVHEVSRGSPLHSVSHSPRTPVRTPVSVKDRVENFESSRSPAASAESIKSNSGRKKAALVAAGVGAGAFAASKLHGDDHSRNLSPVQSVSSLRGFKGDFVEHNRVRSIKSDMSIGSHRDRGAHSPVSGASSPIPASKRQAIKLEDAYEILPEDQLELETPHPDDVENWTDEEQDGSEFGRRDLEADSLLSSARDSRRMTNYTEDGSTTGFSHDAKETIKYVGAINPEYVHTPIAVESAVASLQEPSMMSVQSSVKSSPVHDPPRSQAESLGLGESGSGSKLIEPGRNSKERWEAIRDKAMAMTRPSRELHSPPQSDIQSIDEQPFTDARYVPGQGQADMPAIGFYQDEEEESEFNTNPSIVSDKMGGPSYQPTPSFAIDREHDHTTRDLAVPTAAAATGLGLGLAAHTPEKTRQYQPSIEDLPEEDDLLHNDSPDIRHPGYASSPQKDEGYNTAEAPGLSPVPQPANRDLGAEDQFDDDEEIEDDPFTVRAKYASGHSHGMASPIYDSAMGRGLDQIESKDIVALMNHLAVRDGQRNARDTEILVTLVRSAAEMRNSFEEMKRFIAEQDRLIVNNMERGQEQTVQRVLGGPRPLPSASPRTTPRRQPSDETDQLQAKRRNVFQRALKGLSGRNSKDLAKIEDMLMQLLGEVEGLKESQALNPRPSQTHTQTTSLNSYEHLRAAPDPGYEPEGQAGTNSSPAQSGYLSNPSSRHLTAMHSGYSGRRGSDGAHRISTVLEGDEEVDEPQSAPRGSQYQVKPVDNTPPPAGQRGFSNLETPPEQTGQFLEPTPRTDKTRSRHKSGASSIFSGFPRISRWSKTTASTVPESGPSSAKKARPYSHNSQSGSNLQLDYDDYDMQEGDRLRNSRSVEYDGGRSPSPLIPEYDEDDYPKYHAHRNSLNLQHPQPRPGPTHRHQNYLENQAISYENPPTPDADQWGSAPALALNKSRFSGGSSNAPGLSPVYSDDGYSQHSASEQVAPARPPKIRDDGPLVPPKIPMSQTEPQMYTMPMSSSGMHIASPLEPIEEVRRSLETDRNSVRLDMTPSPRPTAMQSVQRKITGPREMPRSGSAGSASRRRQAHSESPVSFETYRTSLDSETF